MGTHPRPSKVFLASKIYSKKLYKKYVKLSKNSKNLCKFQNSFFEKNLSKK